jgi:adenylate cyclase
MIHFISILILLLGVSCSGENAKNLPTASKGILDLRSWNFEQDGKTSLYGEWEFYYKQFISPDEFKDSQNITPDYISIPALWSTKKVNEIELSNQAYATYRLKLFVKEKSQPYGLRIGDMYSAYTLYVNGVVVASNGIPGKNKLEEVAEWYPVVSFVNLKEGENEIVLHISNFAHRKGGTWADFDLGLGKDISNYKHWLIAFDFFLIGSLLIMAIYHFGLYTLRRVDVTSLLLGLFCICSTVRIGVTGERFFVPFLPFRSFETQVSLEYISFFLSFGVFYQFLISLFQYPRKKWIAFLSWSIVISGVILVLATKATVYSHTAIPFQIFILLQSVYMFGVMFRAIRRKAEGARAALSGIVILFSTFIFEMLYQNEVTVFSAIPPIFVYPFGVFLFLFFQSYLLSDRFSQAFYSVERLSDNLLKTNEAISKFVPTEFLEQLNKKSVMDISLGDQVQRKMAVLFSDIREFTNLSETMSPAENFNFINAYIKRMNPHILSHNGFIDKYIGDAIMALFPNHSEDAVKSAIEMLTEVRVYNEFRATKGYKPIQVGFGIHTGNLMLGIIGADNRMDGTVISDSVNLSARLEGLTKEYKVSIIVSEIVIEELKKDNTYHTRLLDRVQVKGKQEKVTVYQVYDGISKSEIEAIDSIKSDFEKGVESFHKGEYIEAKKYFLQANSILPQDYPTVLYLKRCSEKI